MAAITRLGKGGYGVAAYGAFVAAPPYIPPAAALPVLANGSYVWYKSPKGSIMRSKSPKGSIIR